MSSPREASAAQTLSASLSYGLFTGVATIVSGWLYGQFQGMGYLVMALMAVVGAGLALGLPRATSAQKDAQG